MSLSKQTLKKISPEKYQEIHHWLRKNFGKATKCDNKDCTKKSVSYQWALRTGFEYYFKRKSFQMLCRSCHAKIDVTAYTRKKMSKIARENVGHLFKSVIHCTNCNVKVENAHVVQKYCSDCRKIVSAKMSKDWRLDNIEQSRLLRNKYYWNNLEKMRKYYREFYHKNKP